MSLKQKIIDIATQAAQSVVAPLINLKGSQVSGTVNSNVAKVAAVKGNQVTINMPNGQQVTVTNTGQRYLGAGDDVVTDNQNFCF